MISKAICLLTGIVLLIGCSVKNAPSQQEAQLEIEINGEKTMIKKVIKTDEEWKKILTPEQYRIMREGGTEIAFSGKYNNHYEKGIYHCAGCGTPLFRSETKYDHGTGWPSFTAAENEDYIEYRTDYSMLMKRTEVRCAVCGAHLGHVFNDGPPPAHKHYCINSAALNFEPRESLSKEAPDEMTKAKKQSGIATFAAGCFWGVEHKFRQVKGVLSTVVGYSGGNKENPTYKQVCSDKTGHAEAVRIIFDPSVVSYKDLLKVFFSLHDPTQINRQGPDIGTQYRSVIFYHNEEQKKTAQELIDQLEKSGRFGKPIVTELIPAPEFYEAEEYHQRYYEKLKKRG
jgi:peptide methionine sulfoxide reductase msrA/msrB